MASTVRHPLVRYVVRRAVFAAVLVFLVSSGAMLLARVAPGDFASEMLVEGASRAAMARERERLGLDRSVTSSYLEWLGRATRLEFGESFKFGRPVASLVVERAGNTAELALAALVVATALGLPLGVVAGTRSGFVPSVIRAVSVVALSLPPLILAILLAWVAARAGWWPDASAQHSAGIVSRSIDHLRLLALPVCALALPVAATLERLQARAIRDALDEPCLLAASARGIPTSRLRWRHALSLALTPVLSVYGLMAGSLLSGSLAVEVVMAWPGLGRLMYEALLGRDVNLVAGCAAAGAAFVAVGTLASDIATAWADPRVREGP
jgi:ABC-type dipeptide/oligopeptide/nickel transport system permease component